MNKKKEWENDKCRREVDEECKNEKNCQKKIFERERKFWYDDVRGRQREEFEGTNFYKVLHRRHDVDLERYHGIFCRIRKFFKEKEHGADGSAEEIKKLEKEWKQEFGEDKEWEYRWMNFFCLMFI